MELKYGGTNFWSTKASGSNRTFMELKSVLALIVTGRIPSSNRTFMELKLPSDNGRNA